MSMFTSFSSFHLQVSRSIWRWCSQRLWGHRSAPLENTFFTLIDRSKAEHADQRAQTCISSHICVVYMNAKGTKIKYILLEKYMFCVKVFWSHFWSPSTHQGIIWTFQTMVSSFNVIGRLTQYSDPDSLPSAWKQEESFNLQSSDAFQMCTDQHFYSLNLAKHVNESVLNFTSFLWVSEKYKQQTVTLSMMRLNEDLNNSKV